MVPLIEAEQLDRRNRMNHIRLGDEAIADRVLSGIERRANVSRLELGASPGGKEGVIGAQPIVHEMHVRRVDKGSGLRLCVCTRRTQKCARQNQRAQGGDDSLHGLLHRRGGRLSTNEEELMVLRTYLVRDGGNFVKYHRTRYV